MEAQPERARRRAVVSRRWRNHGGLGNLNGDRGKLRSDDNFATDDTAQLRPSNELSLLRYQTFTRRRPVPAKSSRAHSITVRRKDLRAIAAPATIDVSAAVGSDGVTTGHTSPMRWMAVNAVLGTLDAAGRLQERHQRGALRRLTASANLESAVTLEAGRVAVPQVALSSRSTLRSALARRSLPAGWAPGGRTVVPSRVRRGEAVGRRRVTARRGCRRDGPPERRRQPPARDDRSPAGRHPGRRRRRE